MSVGNPTLTHLKKFLEAGQRAQVEQESFFLKKLILNNFSVGQISQERKNTRWQPPKNTSVSSEFPGIFASKHLSQESQEDIGGSVASRRFHSNHGTSTAAHVVNDPQLEMGWDLDPLKVTCQQR